MAVSVTALSAGVLATVYGLLTGANSFGRALGAFLDPNEYAAAMVASIGLGVGVALAARSVTGRIVALVGVLVCAYGLLASQSRGGLLAAATVVVVIVLTSHGRERARMLGASFVVLAVLAAIVVATPVGAGLQERLTNSDSSGRSDLWRIAQAQIADEPVRGVGLGNYPVLANRYITRETENTELINNGAPRTTHNSYLEILAELGIVGMLAWSAFVLGCLGLGMRALRDARQLGDPRATAVIRGILAATVGLLATCVFMSGHYAELLWVLLALCVSSAAWARRERAAQASVVAAAVHPTPAI
jgi:O-antigen ligase